MDFIDCNDFISRFSSYECKKIQPAIAGAITEFLSDEYDDNSPEWEKKKLRHIPAFVKRVGHDTKVYKRGYADPYSESVATSFMNSLYGKTLGKKFALAIFYWFREFTENPKYYQKIEDVLCGTNVTLEMYLDDRENLPKVERIPEVSERKTLYGCDVHPSTLRIIQNYEHDHEHHELERDFLRFCGLGDDEKSTQNCGYWYLTAGPGMGKTAIMASIARQMQGNCIPYFFSYNYEGHDFNKRDGYYSHVLAQLSALYSYDIHQSSRHTKTKSEWFFSIITDLSQKGYINQKQPLILIIDSLDEMTNAPKDNPVQSMGLPFALPPHVYIALSERRNAAIALNTFQNLRALCLHEQPYLEQQMLTIEKYALSRASKQPYISNFYESDTLETYIKFICKKADYNFLILRTILYEKQCWEHGKLKIELSRNLDQFYRNYLERIFKVYGIEDAKGFFCFAFSKKISLDAFYYLMNLAAPAEYNEKVLGSWEQQGLIHRSYKDEQHWLQTFHKSFYDALRREIIPKNKNFIVTNTFLQNLETSFGDSPLLNLNTIDERINIFIYLCILRKDATRLRRHIVNLNFWQAGANSLIGLNCIFNHLKHFKIDNNVHKIEFEHLIDDLIIHLARWVKAKELTNRQNEPYDLGNIRNLTKTQFATVDKEDNSIIFFNHLRKNYREGGSQQWT